MLHLEKKRNGTSKNLPKSFIEGVGQYRGVFLFLESFHVWTCTVVDQLGMDQNWIPKILPVSQSR